jgi:4-hydroxyphenylpyruvate dioxygenase
MPETVPLRSIHHVELVVGNAKQAAYFYRKAFGFSQIAYLGPETGHRDRASYALQQGEIRLVLTTPLTPEHPLSDHHKLHGDGVRDIAFLVDDVEATHAEVLRRGAASAVDPHEIGDEGGTARHAAVATYGDTIHSFYSLADYDGPFIPGFRPDEKREPDVGLKCIDHIVGNVEDRKMDSWVDWYINTFGFDRFVSFDDKDICTDFTALRSKVMASGDRAIKFPINEPADGKQEEPDPGVHRLQRDRGRPAPRPAHRDILETIAKLREQRRRVPRRAGHLLRDGLGPGGRDRRGPRHIRRNSDPRRPRRRGLPAAALHQAAAGPADAVLRDHPALRQRQLRQGQLQGALRGHRARAGAGAPRQPRGRREGCPLPSLGEIPPKRTLVFKQAGGGMYYEHLIGNLGFTGLQSLLYTRRRPTAW